MKITESQLRELIRSQLINEGFFDSVKNFFGGRPAPTPETEKYDPVSDRFISKSGNSAYNTNMRNKPVSPRYGYGGKVDTWPVAPEDGIYESPRKIKNELGFYQPADSVRLRAGDKIPLDREHLKMRTAGYSNIPANAYLGSLYTLAANG